MITDFLTIPKLENGDMRPKQYNEQCTKIFIK